MLNGTVMANSTATFYGEHRVRSAEELATEEQAKVTA